MLPSHLLHHEIQGRRGKVLIGSGTALIKDLFTADLVFSALVNVDKDGELLTLDAIRSGIRFQKSVAEGWLKVINTRYFLMILINFFLNNFYSVFIFFCRP